MRAGRFAGCVGRGSDVSVRTANLPGRGRFDLRDLKRHGVRYTGAVDVAGRAALSVQLTSDPHVRSC